DRAETAGLVERATDSDDARLVRLHLTEEGRMKVDSLASQHLRELERLGVHMSRLWAGLE
ncbi:MAG TPA: MarR family transcriptional regulator, partial [Acidimicrobiia bacterium]|nr:MarR family transcriptional regulator [Acidimicrobiia bacterium]